ncbi:hypothetical protein EJB05_45739, partial [Eragrostis curvula]
LCWAIFNGLKSNTFFLATYLIRAWLLLHREEEAKSNIKNGCRLLNTVIMEVFAKVSWKISNKIVALTLFGA